MDNASKALIMAGAVLISIALVGVGVYIFSTTSDLTNNAGQTMNEVSASTTNSQFSAYAGTKVRGSEVKALLEKIRLATINETLPVDMTSATGSAVTYTITDGTLTPSETIRDTAYYTVSFSDTNSDGYYDAVTISAN